MSQSFPIAPAGAGPLIVLALVGAVLIGVSAAVGRSSVAARRARFEISDRSLILRGDWWGRSLPREALRTDDARVVNLAEERQLQPVRRTFGTGMPGYAGGWFRLRDGQRALLYLTDQTRAVYIPTTLGYSVLVSPRDPDGFVAALRQ